MELVFSCEKMQSRIAIVPKRLRQTPVGGSPAFMRGKERFSGPEEVRFLIMRFSAGHRKPRAKAHFSNLTSLPLD
jgi:hypothetical protein